MSRKLTQEEFIAKAKEKHGDKYDYSKVVYVNNNTKVKIVCPIHGEFNQRPSTHLLGIGCPHCSKKLKGDKRRYTLEQFIDKANKVHHNKYDYSQVKYENSQKEVSIICPIHGTYSQKPCLHLYGEGCPKCAIEKRAVSRKSDIDSFIKKARKIHGIKYDYSKSQYVNSRTKICIVCTKHGEFWQKPNAHLNGFGCPVCGGTAKLDTQDFIQKAKMIHGDKYDYSKVEYINNSTKVCIICPEHGEFWVRPADHITLKSGCPKCSSSHMENEVRHFLLSNHINFEEQKQFEWIGNLRLDFYVPVYNIAIECQGLQHFEPVEYFGGYESWLRSKERDERKRQLCEEHGIKILYYANYDYGFPYEVITDKEKLLECIINTKNLED